MYWNKNRSYRNVLYMNLVFILFGVMAYFESVREGISWVSIILALIIVVGFNVERYLHYLAYGQGVLDDYYNSQETNENGKN